MMITLVNQIARPQQKMSFVLIHVGRGEHFPPLNICVGINFQNVMWVRIFN